MAALVELIVGAAAHHPDLLDELDELDPKDAPKSDHDIDWV